VVTLTAIVMYASEARACLLSCPCGVFIPGAFSSLERFYPWSGFTVLVASPRS
jgi:hypothetical protein